MSDIEHLGVWPRKPRSGLIVWLGWMISAEIAEARHFAATIGNPVLHLPQSPEKRAACIDRLDRCLALVERLAALRDGDIEADL